MKGGKEQLAKEALGSQRFKYTVELSRIEDGSFELSVVAAGQEAFAIPGPFVGANIDAVGVSVGAFLAEWKKSDPVRKNQVLCCTKAVENALARGRKKLADPNRGRSPAWKHRDA